MAKLVDADRAYCCCGGLAGVCTGDAGPPGVELPKPEDDPNELLPELPNELPPELPNALPLEPAGCAPLMGWLVKLCSAG